MRSSEVAARAGVNVQTLRYYERRGLVEEPPRSPSGYRAYPAGAVRTVRFVKRAQELGFTLAEVLELLNLAAGGPEDCEPARALAQSRMDELDRRISDLRRMRDSLADLAATCDLPRADRRCPLLLSLHEDGEI
ncbi:MerR family transcriptional regulator [Actinokineospora sp. HUAS TT18]|uniref:MerR family transcriptional regulator n=1 Tax=Actinokineospora sp. HUAS TT18 TaxID=3447451 RepID=UPI003F5211CB